MDRDYFKETMRNFLCSPPVLNNKFQVSWYFLKNVISSDKLKLFWRNFKRHTLLN